MWSLSTFCSHKIRKDKTNEVSTLPDGTLRIDEESGTFQIHRNGKWESYGSIMQHDRVYKKSMSKLIEPDSESAGNIGFSNKTNGFSSIALGKMARTYLRTQEAYSSGAFERAGDSQVSRFIVKGDVEANEKMELTIDDESYVMPSRKASVYLNIKFFVKSAKKHWIIKQDFILCFDGKILQIENLRTKNMPEGWVMELQGDEKEVEFICSTPIKTRWVGICKTIEIIN